MYEKKIPSDYNCGMTVLMDIIGGKWKTYLLFLINERPRRPSDLHRSVPGASLRVLNMQLRELEFHGVITKIIYPEAPPRVEYSLTEFGKSILPIIEEMDRWGNGNLDEFRKLMEEKKSLVEMK